MRVVLSGGGTGGHVYPALAIAEQCLREQPQSEFLYIGTNSGLEKEIVKTSGLDIPFEAIEISGFRRKLVSMDNIKTVIRFFRCVSHAKILLKKFHPDIVVGTGGYVCGPVLYAAAKLGIPTLVHEQNVIPGMTNLFLSRFVSAMAVSFQGTEKVFPKARHVVYTGNPRATSVAKADPQKGLQSLELPFGSTIVILVGGSRGAKAINDAMIQITPYLPQLPDVQFVFATGQPYFDTTSATIHNLSHEVPNNLKLMPYIHNMPEVLATTSLIITRSGASSLAEIMALGIPSILIPSPNVTNNHQEHNARRLVEEGAAELILERDLRGDELFAKIGKIIQDPIRSEHMSKQALRLGQPDSAALFVNEMNRLIAK